MASKVNIYNILNSLICRGRSDYDLFRSVGVNWHVPPILVMHNGAITGELRGDEATEEKIIKLASR